MVEFEADKMPEKVSDPANIQKIRTHFNYSLDEKYLNGAYKLITSYFLPNYSSWCRFPLYISNSAKTPAARPFSII